MYARSRIRPGFTITELLVVIGVIAVLMALLLPALAGVRKTGYMTDATNNMKQIATFMRMYSTDNREFIVPSQFDYTASAASYPVKVRSDSSLGSWQYQGTWTDILWATFEIGILPDMVPFNNMDYRFDSPDAAVYGQMPNFTNNVFRSKANNSKDIVNGTGPKPFGNGAQESSLPGFFAANNFFDSRLGGANRWVTNGQIKAPDRSLYLVESYAGETIDPQDAAAWDVQNGTAEVDFRYSGVCLMLFLDGHTSQEGPWTNLAGLEGARRIRVTNPL